MGMSNMVVGKAGEYRVASELLLRGIEVCLPFVDNGSDLILGDGRHIQVKSSQYKTCKLGSTVAWKKKIKYGIADVSLTHPLVDVDYVILWRISSSEFYIMPSLAVKGKTSISGKKLDDYLNGWSDIENVGDGKMAVREQESSNLGKAGELRVASELLLKGYNVYWASLDNGFDLMINNGKRIQVKTGRKHILHGHYVRGQYMFNFKKAISWNTKLEDVQATSHPLDGVDYVILWAVDDDEFYIIPATEVKGKTDISFTADHDRRTQVKWNRWLPYLNNWDVLKGKLPKIEKVPEQLECRQCGHQWKPFRPNPTRCPKCHARWYLEKRVYGEEVQCRLCDYKWKPIGNKTPPYCPKCKSVLWNREAKSNAKPIDDNEIKRLYLAGNNVQQVADMLGTTSTLVWRRAKKMGIVRPRTEAVILGHKRREAEKELVPVG